MKVKIEHKPWTMPGHGNCESYGYAFVDGKRLGTVWRAKDDGTLFCNSEPGHKAGRFQAKGRNVTELKKDIVVRLS